MSGDAERPPVRFEPLRPASRWRLVAAFVLGPIPRMATEDIDLTWKQLLAGWQTVYEPRALVGMQGPQRSGRCGHSARAGPTARARCCTSISAR